MKTAKSILIALFISLSLASFAGKNEEKATSKSREMVANATPDDWKTLAEAASICINKKTNLTEAAGWLDKSISVKETAYNLSVKGDYYMASNLADKAVETYIKAMLTGQKENPNFDVKELQQKIADASKVKAAN